MSDENTGDQPTGDQPTGDQPTGDQPTGDQPTGDQPTGDQPSGGGGLLDQVRDPDLRQWVESKGWKDLDGIANSARNLEKLTGAPADELIRVPKTDDGEATRKVLERLGMPSKPDEYEIPTPEGVEPDEGFQKWARDTFHKAGLTKQQAAALSEEWNGLTQSKMQEQSDSYKAKVAEDEQTLKQEWGNGYDRQVRVAQLAAREMGVEAEQLDAMEQAMGYAATMKFFAGLGKRLGESNFVSGDGPGKGAGGFGDQMTPDEAKAAYSRMVSDPEKQKALMDNNHPAHKEMLAEKRRLFSIIYPDAA